MRHVIWRRWMGNRLQAMAVACALATGILSARADCTVTNLGIEPLCDLGYSFYKGVAGGLYPGRSNQRPEAHQAEGIRRATEEVQPRTPSGTVDTNSGEIVLLSIGMSNTTGEFGSNPGAFKRQADAEPSKNPQLTIVDGAQGGQAATEWTNFYSATWTNVEKRLAQAGVTTNQVQVIWMKQARRNPTQTFPVHAALLQNDLEAILRVAQMRYPNLQIAYLSSRTRSYETNVGRLNPEPFAYESAFSVRWLIEKQLNGSFNHQASRGPVVVPWLAWGPYLWADGARARSDGFTWLCSDLRDDYTHPSTNGVYKVATELLAFFKTDPTAVPWFLRKSVHGQAPVCAPAATTNSGMVPFSVQFYANASDPDGSIQEYWWTFDDGTFSTNANPAKLFTIPGRYTARLTVVDDNGNSAFGTAVIEAKVPGAVLSLDPLSGNLIQVQVTGPTSLNHIVEYSTNLRAWYPLVTNQGAFSFLDSPAASKFYRVRSVP